MLRLTIIAVLLSAVAPVLAQEVKIKGLPILGLWWDGQFGAKTAISADGNVVAISAPGDVSGKVFVYQWQDSSWVQRGAEIWGQTTSDDFGEAMCLSADGTVLAVGAPRNDIAGSTSGHVRVYDWVDTTWVQRGKDIFGAMANDQFGGGLAMSTDGNVLAVGAPTSIMDGAQKGYVRVLEWVDTAWVAKGDSIRTLNGGGSFGANVAISDDGNLLLISANKDSENAFYSGIVHAYKWNGSSWELIWNTAGNEGDQLGKGLSLSPDGKMLAVSAIYSDHNNQTDLGHVQIYEWNGSTFVERGPAIIGTAEAAQFGASIDISDDGSMLVVGAPSSINSFGEVKTYHWNGTDWESLGEQITGNQGSYFGWSTAITGDGKSWVAGGPLLDNFGGNNTGISSVYEVTLNQTGLNHQEKQSTISCYPNPAEDHVLLRAPGKFEYAIYDVRGEIVGKGVSSSSQKKVSVSNLISGVYIFSITSTHTSRKVRFVKL
ncbi:MAG: T9SS type A sorting domain-containing protein [Bacteroidetes bacterium]|nr:MAG: T9SS type A sorting domain-containing protein [Bacteroidota bacterium]